MLLRLPILCKRFFLFAILIACTINVAGQSKSDKIYRHELRVSSVNDSFLGLGLDHYYTNGLHLNYSRLLGSGSFFSDIVPQEQRKLIFHFKLAHQIYTPRSIRNSDPSKIDRPYAGYFYFKADINSFWRQNNNLRLGLNVGVIGPASGAEEIQTQWHKWFGLPQPRGWEFQIENEPVINLDAAYKHAWFLSGGADFIAATSLRAGTAFNDFSTGARFRFGDINPISHSAITNSQLGRFPDISKEYHKEEWFFFLGLKSRFVLHNALIEGGVVNETTPAYTRRAEPHVFNFNWGFSYSTPVFTWKFIMNQVTPETKEAKGHNFVSLDIAIRF